MIKHNDRPCYHIIFTTHESIDDLPVVFYEYLGIKQKILSIFIKIRRKSCTKVFFSEDKLA